jgi:P27 family predicted phage terminase small subunit
MTRGRKPTPTGMKAVAGNPGKRPLNDQEAKIEAALPEAPDELNGFARAEWVRVSADLYRAGLLTRIDRAALASYCMAYGRWAQAERAIAKMAALDPITGGLMVKTSNGNAVQNPLVGTANKAMADMVRYAAEFGMTPSARSRISAEPPGDDTADPAAKYF